MIKILANDGIDAKAKLILENAGYKVNTQKVEQAELAAFIQANQVSVLTVRSATQVRKELIDACPQLKIIGRGGVGMDNIDVEYARSIGRKVINTPAASSLSVAELVFAHAFSMSRFLHQAYLQMPTLGVSQFEKLKKTYATGTELRGKTMGIIGFGRIGQEVAKIAVGLGMQVLANDAHAKEVKLKLAIPALQNPEITIHTKTLDEVIGQSDFISVHIPGGELFNYTHFCKMKPNAILINAARGGVFNENDLIKALDENKIKYAALDVFNNEPTPNEKLLSHTKIASTPHIGAATNEAQERIGEELANLIISALQ